MSGARMLVRGRQSPSNTAANALNFYCYSILVSAWLGC